MLPRIASPGRSWPPSSADPRKRTKGLASRRRNDSDVSLFPFLSVLACVIGTLVLLLSAVAVGGIGGRSLDQVRLSQRLDAAEIFLAGGEALLEDFEAQIELREQAQEASERLGRKLAALGLNPDISLHDLQALMDLKRAESLLEDCLLYTSPSPRDRQKSRMPSSA